MDNESELQNSITDQVVSEGKISKKIIAILILSIPLVIIGIYFVLNPAKNIKSLENTTNNSSSQNMQSKSQNNLNVKPAPFVKFEKYTNKSNLPTIPDTFNSYILKSDFTNNEVLTFAKKLGLENFKIVDNNNNNILVANLDDINKRGILSFNKKSGAFSFESYGVLKPSSYALNQNVFEESAAFLGEIGIYDNTISCNNSYEKFDTSSQVTFVECHRDWKKTKIPVVNLGGILSLPEDKKISDLQTGWIDDSIPEDLSIKNVKNSDGVLLTNANGKSRPDDFNTITIGISKDGRILSVVSSIKLINNAKAVDPQNDTLSLQEALALFQNNKSQFSITVPAGSGVVDWDKVYVGNKALADNAEINDIALVFLEKPANIAQVDYSPYYLIRGTAALKNGYTVKYVQAVSALKNRGLTPIGVKPLRKVAGVASQDAANPNLQMGSFTPGASPSPNTIILPTITPITPPSTGDMECNLSNGIGEIKIDVPGYGQLSIVMKNAHTFFLNKTKATNADILAARQALYKAVREQYKINVAKWIKQNNDLTGLISIKSNLTTIDKVKDFFKGTISQIYDDTCPWVSLDPNNIREAPYVCYYEDTIRKTKTPNQLTQEVTNEVVVWALNEIKQMDFGSYNYHGIDEYAQKPDLFPEITLQTFHYVFILPRPVDEQYFKCILTAYSPAIFLYPQKETKVSVKINNAPATYVDPPSANNIWDILAYPDGTIKQDNITRQNLYYEYAKENIKFTEPTTGFIIKTSNLNDFIKNNLSLKLGLNSKETESLISEASNIVSNVSNTYIKISLISKNELDQKLPLSINPTPDNIYRINLYIVPLNQFYNIHAPQISTIKRDGFTVVELGAYSR